GEEQRLRQHAVTGRDELWEEREIEERDLRVQHVGEEALRERARRLGPPRCRGRAEVAAAGIAQRSDAEVREIPGARDPHPREREQRAVDRHDRAAGSPVRKKASTRRHASSQAALWSANVRSKKECGAPGYTSR